MTRIQELEFSILATEVIDKAMDKSKSGMSFCEALSDEIAKVIQQREEANDNLKDAVDAVDKLEKELIDIKKEKATYKKIVGHYKAIIEALRRGGLTLPFDQTN